ncbi:MAG: DUF5765 domain-containing protein [Geminicoccaceae bacterium]
MCWGVAATATMLRPRHSCRRPDAAARRAAGRAATLAYFALMEGLQLAGYAVVGQCSEGVNRAVTLLAYLHGIALQPLVINAFAMELVPGGAQGGGATLGLRAMRSWPRCCIVQLRAPGAGRRLQRRLRCAAPSSARSGATGTSAGASRTTG